MASREWSSYEAAYNYYLTEGFEVVVGTCGLCGHSARCVAPPGLKRVQCPSCGARDAVEIATRYAEP